MHVVPLHHRARSLPVRRRFSQVGQTLLVGIQLPLIGSNPILICGATKKEQEDSTQENRIGGWIGQEGERRKSYSAAVIDGIKINSRIYVGDAIVRKADTILSKGEDVAVCLPGARIEHVTERVEQIMGRGYGGSILIHVGTNNADKEGTTAIVEKFRNLLKKSKQGKKKCT